MAIRSELVASAAQFLQDPSVAASSLDNRVAFLRTKNLTQEEIEAALARTAAGPPATYPQAAPAAGPPQQYYHPYPQNAWQPQTPPPVPRRDWRDWFIMATVVGGVGYGLFTLTKRYVAPLIAPPTPERIEQDKKAIEEKFDNAFALMDQLAKDTETLKAAEQERTERLDTTLAELETTIAELKSANRRRDEEAQRVRDDLRWLKDSLPNAMDAQKSAIDVRLKEVNTELTSLKTLMTQRMNSSSSSAGAGTNSYLRPTSGNAAPASSPGAATRPTPTGSENSAVEAASTGDSPAKQSSQGRASPFNSGNPAKASIPAWQLAMSNKGSGTAATTGSEAGGSAQDEASAS